MTDVSGLFPSLGGVMDERAQDILDEKFPDGIPGGAGANSSATTRSDASLDVPSCDCSCQPLESYSPACRPVCEVKARQCKASEEWKSSRVEAKREQQARTTQSEALEQQLEALTGSAEQQSLATYAMIRGLASMGMALTGDGNANGAKQLTRQAYEEFLETNDYGEAEIEKMLAFFEQTRAIMQSP